MRAKRRRAATSPVLRPPRLLSVWVAIAGLGGVLLGGNALGAEWNLASRFPLEYRSWRLTPRQGDASTLSQFYIPVIATVRPSEQTSFVISTAAGFSRLKGTSSTSLGGTNNVLLQAYHRFPGDRLVLVVGASLPTGKTELNEEELAVSRMLGHPLLGMRMRQYGGGFDLNTGLGLSYPLSGKTTLALAAGYLHPGSYTILNGEPEYSPSPQPSFSAGIETRSPDWAADPRSLSLHATYRFFSPDRLGGEDVFEEGDQFDLALRSRMRFSQVEASVRSLLTIKGQNVQFVPQGASIRDVPANAGTGLASQAGVARSVSERAQVGLELEWRLFQGSDDTERNGHVIGIGPTLGLAVGESDWLRLESSYLTGSMGESDGQSDLRGFSVSASYVWRMVP